MPTVIAITLCAVGSFLCFQVNTTESLIASGGLAVSAIWFVILAYYVDEVDSLREDNFLLGRRVAELERRAHAANYANPKVQEEILRHDT